MSGLEKPELPETVNVPLCLCNKCDRHFYPKVDNSTGKILVPKYCPYRECHSINWNKPKKHYFMNGKNKFGVKSSQKEKPLTILERFRLQKKREISNQ